MLKSCNYSKEIKIGMMLPNLISERYPKDRDYFVDKIKELGGSVIVMDANNNDMLQIQQAKELFAKGVKVLVIVPVNKNTAAQIVRDAHKKGVKVIAYERIISNCDLDYFVSFDNVKIGELMAKYAVSIKPEGKYVLFGGDKSDQNAIWVREGQKNIIDSFVKAGQIEVTYDTNIEDWLTEEAEHEMETYMNLSGGQMPDVILSAYDGLSTGIIKTIENMNIPINKYPIITGQNAEIEACKNIIAGKQSMTVYKSIKKEAQKAALLAIQCAKNEVDDNFMKKITNGRVEVSSILIDPIDINRLNISTLIKEEFLKVEEIYK
jgi:D-xylose transport system substrate-binding protein